MATVWMALLEAPGFADPGDGGTTPQRDLGTSSHIAPPSPSGFRTEGPPHLEVPFGDAESYRALIDRALALHDQMSEVRRSFSRSVQEVLRSVASRAPKKGPRVCPEEEIAVPFARAFTLGQQYLRAGRELERTFDRVRDFDALGESLGLTPDYRIKAKRLLTFYQELVTDYREMKLAFHQQLRAEVRFHGCDPDKLIARAEAEARRMAARGPAVPASLRPPLGPPAARSDSKVVKDGKTPPVKAETKPLPESIVTFYVDNRRCKDAVRLYVDQVLVGSVGGTQRAAFRAKLGPHDLCLLGPRDSRACGTLGTVRRAYLHDGFSISLRCEADPKTR